MSALLERLAEERVASEAALRARRAPPAPPPQRERAARAQRLTSKMQAELDGLPAKIEVSERRLAELDVRLSDPELYRGPAAERANAAVERASAAAEVACLYARWEELEALRAAGA